MNLLFIGWSLGARPSGARSRLEGLLPALVAQQEHRCRIVVGDHYDGTQLERAGVIVHSPDRPHKKPWQRAFFQRGALLKLHRAERFDLVVTELLPPPRGFPYVFTLHDLRWHGRSDVRGRIANRLYAKTLVHARGVHAPSETMVESIERAYPAVRGRVHYVPNAVAPAREAQTPDLDRNSRVPSLEPGYALVVGHFEPRKNWRLVCEMSAKLWEEGIHLPIVLVGTGEELPEVELARLRALAPERRPGTVLRGATDPQVARLMAEAALVIAPSHLEGFGIAPLEALQAGTPVVASDIPAHREVLGDCASFFSPTDLAELCLRVRSVLARGPEERAAAALRGQARAQRYSYALSAQLFAESLRAISEAPPGIRNP